VTARRTVLVLAATTLAGCGTGHAAPPSPAGRLKSVAQWAGVFQQSWDYLADTGLPLSRSADSWDHYNLSYAVDGCVAMFRATGERRYLDRAVEFVTNVAGAAVPVPGGYRGWHSAKSGDGGVEVPLYESYFWRYGTALLAAMRDAGMPADRELLDFAERHVFDKWYSRGPQDTVYRDRTHLTAHWALIAVNLARATSDAARRTRYLEVAASVDDRLHAQLRRNPADPAAYFWSDRWGESRRPGQDVSHGNGVLAYVVEARDRGRAWTGTDLAAFAALLTRVIWPGGTDYRGFVDGSGTDNGWIADGFVKLGRCDPAVQLRLDAHRVVNDQFAANMALNARVLESGRKGRTA
jgi:hypothetical protein